MIYFRNNPDIVNLNVEVLISLISQKLSFTSFLYYTDLGESQSYLGKMIMLPCEIVDYILIE